jgi:hypothetical protein
MEYEIKKGTTTVKFKDLEVGDYYFYPRKDAPWLYRKIDLYSAFRVKDCKLLDAWAYDEVIELEQIQPAIFREKK